MALVSPERGNDPWLQAELDRRYGSQRTRLIYQLVKVELCDDAQKRLMVISNTDLEIDVGLLRWLNNCLDLPAFMLQPFATCDDECASRGRSENEITKSQFGDFRPGLKVKFMFDGGDEKEGLMRWTRGMPVQ